MRRPDIAGAVLQAASRLPDVPAAAEQQPWQTEALQAWDVLGPDDALTVTIGRLPPAVDPRLLAAARVLCSGSEADVAGRRRGQLREIDAQLAPHIEVSAATRAVAEPASLWTARTSPGARRMALLSGAWPGWEG